MSFRRCLKRLERSDTLVVTRLDRLCRNLRDMLNILHDLNERGVSFLSIKEEWVNLGSASGKLLLHVLSACAEFERELIKARTEEGRARYVANGGKLGRRSKLNDKQRRLMLQMLGENNTQDENAAIRGVTQQTVSCQLNCCSEPTLRLRISETT
jgi:DNA invertase Pin-like site-specific DNA recombinase